MKDDSGASLSGPGSRPTGRAADGVSPVPASIPSADDYEDGEFDYCGNIGCCDGWVADCFDGFCVNAEDGCDLCLRRCDWCNPKERNQ